MAYNKTTWTDRESEFPNRYKDQNENVLQLTRDEGVVSSTGTFINAAVMNNIEDGIEEVDLKTDTISRYITATAGSNGDFHINLGSSFTLTEGLTIKVKFPAATNGASNARLSINGASGTYYNVATKFGTTIKAQNLEEKNLELIYDGVKFRAAVPSGAFIELASNYSVSNNTLTNIPYTILKYDTDGFYNPAEPTKLTIPAGVKVVRIGGLFDWDINANGRREMIIRKNGGVSFPSAAAVLPVDTIRTTVPIVSPPLRVEEGDFFEMRVRQTSGVSLNLDNAFNRNNFFIEVIE